MDAITSAWMRNKSDELAVGNGCYFVPEEGAWVVWWIENLCRLYEGRHAGERMLLRSGNPDVDQIITQDWDDGGRELSVERANKYAEWIASGKGQPDWQYECTMRLFGWMRHSERWERDIRRFNQASIWVPKKNKKSPTLAAWSLYLTCGDGEEGAKTFGGAKDGNQAKIAMAHAVAMVEQSKKLSDDCKINKNEYSITHLPTRSVYKPLSSADERSQRTKEGINGNIAIDETHVVDRSFIRIISRAGISREEPLRIEVSTAGNNPDGYGKERQDYARTVADGTTPNDQLFTAIYESPQDLTDEELESDPVKFGKMANPAWNHTTHEEEYLADFSESKSTIAGMADFKMYRLNIWQHTASQWLRMDKWRRCEESGLEFDGPFSIGMDLSKTRDMSAITVSQKHGEQIIQRTHLWITEDYATKNTNKAAFFDWEADGDLIIIPGDTIQQSWIMEKMKGYVENTSCVVFDQTFADVIANWLESDYPKIDLIEFPQSATMMEHPIDDFEADVLECRVLHEPNRCLDWQAGHTTTKENAVGKRILAKPKRDDYRKIDGMVTSVMSHWGVAHIKDKRSVYADRGVIAV